MATTTTAATPPPLAILPLSFPFLDLPFYFSLTRKKTHHQRKIYRWLDFFSTLKDCQSRKEKNK